MTSGSRNAFQVVTTASTLTVASAGRARGRRTRQKKPNELQPSIRAASSSSAGMLRKNGRRIMQFNKGYLSPYMVTDAERMEAVLDKP